MSSQTSQPSPGEGNPLLSYYREYTEKTPCVTQATLLVLVVSYLLSWLVATADVLGNTPFFTIFCFEIYRLLLSPLVGNNFMSLALVVLSFPSMGARVENCLGSCAFISLMGTLTLLTGLVFTVICLVLNSFCDMPEAVFFHCRDFWLVLFGLITMECTQCPEQSRRMMGIPLDIPNKYYPLVLYILFIFVDGIRLDYAIAIGVGFCYEKEYFDRIKPSSYFLESFESPTGILSAVTRSKGWVMAGAATGHDVWIALNSTTAGTTGGTTGSAGGAGAPTSILKGWNAWAAQEEGATGGTDPTGAPFSGQGRTLGAPLSSGGDDVSARRLAALTQQQGGSPPRSERGERTEHVQRRMSISAVAVEMGEKGDKVDEPGNSSMNPTTKRD